MAVTGMWHGGTRLSGHGGDELRAGLYDPSGLFQP